MTAIIHSNVFGPTEKLEEGLKRWCWEKGREVCKEVIKVDKKLMWAECMEYEELVRETVDNDVITIPVDEKGLVKELDWRDFFRSQRKDLNNNSQA
eukprot:TRINITY_DN20940_c0_g1_i1.p2 TRINITY_DN20940_c0_g1~~TRINITY_DN20940_c0_g1_i1.p2  ORF type:complete len:110 (-),score=59.36 TRINITY_DN20940_c0_g1_i1:183-470(-)